MDQKIELDYQYQNNITKSAIECMDNVSGATQESVRVVRDILVEQIRNVSSRVTDSVIYRLRDIQESAASAIRTGSTRFELAIEHETQQRNRPCMRLRPTLHEVDGQWEARYGDEGPRARGDSPRAAYTAFDKVWNGQ